MVVLILVVATVVLAPLAQRFSLPYPAVLLAFGMVLALVPKLPVPEVDPEWILPAVLPPLLFAAARHIGGFGASACVFCRGASAVPVLAAGAVVSRLRRPRRRPFPRPGGPGS